MERSFRETIKPLTDGVWEKKTNIPNEAKEGENCVQSGPYSWTCTWVSSDTTSRQLTTADTSGQLRADQSFSNGVGAVFIGLAVLFLLGTVCWAIRDAFREAFNKQRIQGNDEAREQFEIEAVSKGFAEWTVDQKGAVSWRWKEDYLIHE